MVKDLAAQGSNRKKLIIKLSEYKGNPLLDLRYFYYHDETQAMIPTSKGIAITRSNYMTLKKAIEEHHEEIMDWLQVKYVPQNIIDIRDKTAEHDRATVPDVKPGIKVNPGCTRGNSVFNIQHKGSYDEVTVDSEHPFISNLLDKIEDNDTQELVLDALGKIFSAHTRATFKFAADLPRDSEAFFAQLKYEWEILLKSYAKEY